MAAEASQPYVTIRTRRPADRNSLSSADSTYGSGNGDYTAPSATHDISRVNYHVKHIDSFAKTLEDSASRAFPNRGRSLQRYKKVQTLLLHWKSDDLFVLPELEDLERCLREDYNFETDIFPIPSENAHLELMLKIGAMIKEHEANDTLFVVYYGGHARIDESRQSTWCATRNPESPWLQWSAIQTLLERSMSDTLILLDCCAGAASATFPNGKSITETISASSWDAIAPDPGRYSFTNALIEVLQEWRLRIFSAAMLHAEILARLKHPRPITINGKHFEARSTPVHFMMTSNHRAPSIELGRIVPEERRPPSPPQDLQAPQEPLEGTAAGPFGRGPFEGPVQDPNEDVPHVMISLALEDDQRLDLNAWEQWLASFPALAKYVKVQGVFKSHSTLLLLSMPVMVWDLLPEDHACSFVAFIRSNNLLRTEEAPPRLAETNVQVVRDGEESEETDDDTDSVFSGTTFTPTERRVSSIRMSYSSQASTSQGTSHGAPSRSGTSASIRSGYRRAADPPFSQALPPGLSPLSSQRGLTNIAGAGLGSTAQLSTLRRQQTAASSSSALPYISEMRQDDNIARMMIMNQQRSSRRTTFEREDDVPEGPALAPHIVERLEEYFQREPNPSVGVMEFFASNLGVETRDIDLWFHRRRQQELMEYNLQNLKIDDHPPETSEAAKMILPGHLNKLLEIFPPNELLLVDLRSPTDFEKSHICGAVNLRVPVSFVQFNFDLIERAFTDEQSRRNFPKWHATKCVVFYDRVVEFPWECPVAEVLCEQLRERGWSGDYFILKGHYREFSSSFDKYIAGDKMTQDAKDYLDGLRERAPVLEDESKENEEKYGEWLRLLENEDRVPPTDLIPTKKEERRLAVQQHQEELEAELESRSPALYNKARDLRPADARTGVSGKAPWGSTAPQRSRPKDVGSEPLPDLVEPLARGLEKMHEAGYATPTPPSKGGYASNAATYDKLGDMPADEFDEIDPKNELLQDDPAFQKAGDLGADQKRAKERPFWKRLRSAK